MRSSAEREIERCDIAIIPSVSTLLLPVDLLQLSCGFALESTLTLLIKSALSWLSAMGSGEEDDGIVRN
jgi:hypothetical protein